jgi:hypothetical protein
MVDEPAPVDDHQFLPAPTPNQLLSPGRMANLCEDGESSDSDDGGLPSVRKIVAHTRRKVVIDLTLDDDESDRDDNGATEVSCLRSTRTTPTHDADSTLTDRPLPECRPTPFLPSRPHRAHTLPTAAQRCPLWPHLAERDILGRTFLCGHRYIAGFNNWRTPVLL